MKNRPVNVSNNNHTETTNVQLGNLQLLIQVSESCPLDCIYCYKEDKSSLEISNSTARKIFQLVDDHNDSRNTTFIWLGAEPLTAGLNFFKRMRKIQKEVCTNAVRNIVQTNGVLLNTKMADYFAEEDFQLSFSLDGPAFLHNRTRPYLSGRGSYDGVMEAIKLMKERGQKPGAVAVITRLSLPYLDEIYDFFKSQNLNLQANTVVDCGNAKNCDDNILLRQDERAEALCRLFDLWFYDVDEAAIDVRPLSLMVESFLTGKPAYCEMMECCQLSILGISADGNMYPCARFSDRKMSYGNVNDITSLHAITKHPIHKKMMSRYKKQKDCKSCEYESICNAGCAHSALLKGDLTKKDPNCKSIKKVFKHIEDGLSTEAWKNIYKQRMYA